MHPLKGRKQSPEHIEKRAAASRGLKRSDEIKRKLSESHKGKKLSEEQKGKIREKSKGNDGWKYVNRDDKYKENMSASIKALGRTGEKATYWKGGKHFYRHRLAREIFGKEFCEMCSMSSEESKIQFGKELSMHCTSFPKDYSILEESNWMTLCVSCHEKLEYSLRDPEVEKERRRKISEGHLGRKKSEETKQRMSEAQKKWREEKKQLRNCVVG